MVKEVLNPSLNLVISTSISCLEWDAEKVLACEDVKIGDDVLVNNVLGSNAELTDWDTPKAVVLIQPSALWPTEPVI